jgi:uncharacterized protein
MRIVLDSNVLLVSISDRSPYHWIYRKLIERQYDLCVTTEIVFEYAEVIEEHMGIEVSESVVGVLENLSNVHIITSWFKFDLIKKDRDDNKFVDCAVASNAQFIVTEDKDFRVLKKIDFPKIEVLGIKEFEKKLNQEGSRYPPH